MLGYAGKRLLSTVGMLASLTVVVFLLFAALPADPAALTCGQSCTPQVVEANRHRLGLDRPLPDQYLAWVQGIAVGRTYNEGQGVAEIECGAPCLGYSFSRQAEVTDLIGEALPVTGWLVLGAFVIWMSVGVGSGVVAALTRGRWPDVLLRTVSLVAYSLPAFFVGLILLLVVVVHYGLLPYPDYAPPSQDPARFLSTMVLPWLTVALSLAAFYTRLTRATMIETMEEDFVRTARAKGLSEPVVTVRHALRAGITPLVTIAGLDVGLLIGGAAVAEMVFNLPGLGRLAVSAVVDSDLPVIVGVTLISAVFVVAANLLVDLLYVALDPRVRLA